MHFRAFKGVRTAECDRGTYKGEVLYDLTCLEGEVRVPDSEEMGVVYLALCIFEFMGPGFVKPQRGRDWNALHHVHSGYYGMKSNYLYSMPSMISSTLISRG